MGKKYLIYFGIFSAYYFINIKKNYSLINCLFCLFSGKFIQSKGFKGMMKAAVGKLYYAVYKSKWINISIHLFDWYDN